MLGGTEVVSGSRAHVEPVVGRDECVGLFRRECREVSEEARVEAAAKQMIERRVPRARRAEGNCPEKAPAWRRLKARDRRRKSGEEKIASVQ